MKKKLPILIVTIAVLLLVPITLIAVFSAKLIDRSDCSGVAYGDTVSFSDRKNDLLFNAFENVNATSGFDVSLNENQLNLLLNSLLREKLAGSKGITLTVTGEGTAKGKLSVPIGATATVTCFDVKGKSIDDDLILYFENIKVGDFSVDFSKKVLSLFKNKVKSATEALGKGFSYENMTYTLSADELKKTFENSENENSDLYAMLLDRIDREKSASFFWCKSGKSGARIDLSGLAYDETRDGSVPYDIKLPEVKAKCETLVTAAAISKGDVPLVFRYLVQGYEKLADTEKTAITKFDFSSVGISAPAEYKGTTGDEKTMAEIIGSQLTTASLGFGGLSVKVDETAFDGIFIKQKAVGKGTTFCRINGTSVSYLTVEALYCDITDDSFGIKLVINVNGFRMIIDCDFDCYTGNDVKAVLNLRGAKLGDYDCTEEEKSRLLAYLSGIFRDIDWITVNEKQATVAFDFSSFINSKTLTKLFQIAFNTELKAVGETLTDIGYIELKIKIGLF